jgi:hypothetical protein
LYSDFSRRFREVADKLGTKTRHDGFDTSMIEVKTEDWRTFIEELCHL